MDKKYPSKILEIMGAMYVSGIQIVLMDNDGEMPTVLGSQYTAEILEAIMKQDTDYLVDFKIETDDE